MLLGGTALLEPGLRAASPHRRRHGRHGADPDARRPRAARRRPSGVRRARLLRRAGRRTAGRRPPPPARRLPVAGGVLRLSRPAQLAGAARVHRALARSRRRGHRRRPGGPRRPGRRPTLPPTSSSRCRSSPAPSTSRSGRATSAARSGPPCPTRRSSSRSRSPPGWACPGARSPRRRTTGWRSPAGRSARASRWPPAPPSPAPIARSISLQADGSAMYTIQALWTQARAQPRRHDGHPQQPGLRDPAGGDAAHRRSTAGPTGGGDARPVGSGAGLRRDRRRHGRRSRARPHRSASSPTRSPAASPHRAPS